MIGYDAIAEAYDNYRSPSIGVATVQSHMHELGPRLDVLDLGCGTGRPIATALAPRVRCYVGVELSPLMAAQFRIAVPYAECLIADMATVDLGDRRFDLIFSWGALCHLEGPRQAAALTRAAHHLRQGGRLLFTGGPEAGTATGAVGSHQVVHYSLGALGYDTLLRDLGLLPIAAGEVEGGSFLFAYRKPEPEHRSAGANLSRLA